MKELHLNSVTGRQASKVGNHHLNSCRTKDLQRRPARHIVLCGRKNKRKTYFFFYFTSVSMRTCILRLRLIRTFARC